MQWFNDAMVNTPLLRSSFCFLLSSPCLSRLGQSLTSRKFGKFASTVRISQVGCVTLINGRGRGTERELELLLESNRIESERWSGNGDGDGDGNGNEEGLPCRCLRAWGMVGDVV